MEKVIVIITTYNREKYLKEAITSVLAQTFQDFSLVILDDASVDDTTATVKAFNDKRIQYIRNQENLGHMGNLKKTFEIAFQQGNDKYLCILADDDKLMPEFLDTAVKILNEYDEVALVGANFSAIDEYSNIIEVGRVPINQDMHYRKREYMHKWLENPAYSSVALCSLVKIDFLKKHNIYYRPELGLASEYYYLFEINLLSEIYQIAMPMVYYREHTNQQSAKPKLIDYMLSVYKHIQKFLADKQIFDLIPLSQTKIFDNIITKLILEKCHKRNFTFDDLKEFGMNEELPLANMKKGANRIKLFMVLHQICEYECLTTQVEMQKNDSNLIVDTNELYRLWLNKVVSQGKGISHGLSKDNNKTAVIFGSMLPAYLLLKDLQKEAINVISFLDNNADRQGKELGGIAINSIDWLLEHKNQVDVVITSIEGMHDDEIKKKISQLIKDSEIPVYSWKELVIAE